MNVLPLIARELRVSARRPVNHWVRVGAAAGLLTLLAGLLWFRPPWERETGARVFSALNFAIFAGLWLLGPLLTADCLSAEKRGGTLGLLFLTPLSAFDVVVAKVVAHALRAGSLLLAAVPVLLVPVLMGGVGGLDAGRAVLLDCGALLLALTAGLLASAFARERSRALVLSLLVSLACAAIFASVYTAARIVPLVLQVRPRGHPGFWSLFGQFWRARLAHLPTSPMDFLSGGGYAGGLRGSDAASVWLAGSLLLFATLLAAVVLWISVRHVRRAWREAPLAERSTTSSGAWFRADWFRRRRRRLLKRHPIAWLQLHSPGVWLTQWGWCVVVLALAGGLNWSRSAEQLVMAGLAFSAVNSLRREQESGMTELLQVAPLSGRQLNVGRLVGLWRQYLPAVLLLVGLAMWKATAFSWLPFERIDPAARWVVTAEIMAEFLIVPVFALHFAKTRLHLLIACLIGWLLGVLFPRLVGIFGFMILLIFTERETSNRNRVVAALVLAGFVLFVLHGLKNSLDRRDPRPK